MNVRPSHRARRGFTLVVLSLGLSACSKEPTPNAEPQTAKKASPAPAATESAPRQSYSESNFSLSIASSGEYSKGTPGNAEIVLQAKAPFHANDKYPYKFKTADTPGLSYADKIVTKDKAKVEHMRVSMPIAFTPDASGKHEVRGLFQFSVCSQDKCLIEKRNLALAIDVK